LLKPI